MLKLKDISVIIPTYNRAQDFSEKTLKAILPFANKLNEIIIVDQSSNNETKKLTSKIKNKNIRYVYSSPPSITIARNSGVKKSSEKSKLICFLDDDVGLGANYFKEIIKIFNNDTDAKAAAGFLIHPEQNTSSKLFSLIKKIFFLGSLEKNRARIISAYGNTYPLSLKEIITSQWLPGVNMVYKKEVFKEQKFDENLLGYTIAEDTDFSFRLFKKYPNSVFITPFAKIVHLTSFSERTPAKEMAYINHIDHFYFNFKNLNNSLKEKIIFVWSLTGIIILNLMLLFSFNKNKFLKSVYTFEALFYCFTHLSKIKKGELRDF